MFILGVKFSLAWLLGCGLSIGVGVYMYRKHTHHHVAAPSPSPPPPPPPRNFRVEELCSRCKNTDKQVIANSAAGNSVQCVPNKKAKEWCTKQVGAKGKNLHYVDVILQSFVGISICIEDFDSFFLDIRHICTYSKCSVGQCPTTFVFRMKLTDPQSGKETCFIYGMSEGVKTNADCDANANSLQICKDNSGTMVPEDQQGWTIVSDAKTKCKNP